MKKFILSLVMSTMILGSSVSVFAQEDINLLQPTAPVISVDDKLTRGASKPSNSASIHNLSVNDYDYEVTEVGYAVFTDKWLTGTSKIGISVNDWNLLTPELHNASNKLVITLYDSKGNVVDSDTQYMSYDYATSFSELSTTEKYYIRFSVENTGHKYSFNGSIYKI